MPGDFQAPGKKAVHARDPASKKLLLQGAIEGHVLVKNDDGALPLKKPKLLSLYGYDAVDPMTMNIPGEPRSWRRARAEAESYGWYNTTMDDGAIYDAGTLIVGGESFHISYFPSFLL